MSNLLVAAADQHSPFLPERKNKTVPWVQKAFSQRQILAITKHSQGLPSCFQSSLLNKVSMERDKSRFCDPLVLNTFRIHLSNNGFNSSNLMRS